MRKFCQVLIGLCVVVFFTGKMQAQENEPEKNEVSPALVRVNVQILGKDTFYLVTLREVPVYPPMVFKNKKEERFYWKTVRDVKKTLPYAKLVSAELLATNQLLYSLETDEERKAYLDEYEKALFKKYEADLRKMTFSQGKMLLKLIDRETDRTSYELIKNYRGNFSAFFWQGIAKIFGADLKSRYDTNKDEDRIIERVITLVESGQL